jgi:predicted transcriptional regulator
MGHQEELQLLALSSVELRVLLAMRLLSTSDGAVEAGIDDFSEYTGYGRTAVSKAVAGLKEAGLIEVTRTKRNLGKLSYNRYVLLPCSPERTPTAVTNVTKTTNTVNLTKEVNTSYLLKGEALEESKMVNRWKEDDDDVAGFGLLDEPSKKETIKKIPSTRYQRPKEEWTPGDVASEFASQLYSKIRGIPGLVNISKLAPVIGKYRKQYGTTAIYELQVLDTLLGDARKLDLVRKEPHNAYKLFLRMLATEGAANPVESVYEQAATDTIAASDGTLFDNSIPGRLALKEHEEELGNK